MALRTIYKMLISVLIILLSIFASTSAIAFEPPNVNIEKALLSGQAAFTARVIKLEEVSKNEFQIVSEATLEINHCYYGVEYENYKHITMRYVSKTILDRSLSVDFEISSEVLFILNKLIMIQPIVFHSDWKDNIDIAFIIGSTYADKNIKEKTIRLINIYLPSIVLKVKDRDVERWATERATQLKNLKNENK